LAALARKAREDRGKRRTLSPRLLQVAEALALEVPPLPIAAIYRRICEIGVLVATGAHFFVSAVFVQKASTDIIVHLWANIEVIKSLALNSPKYQNSVFPASNPSPLPEPASVRRFEFNLGVVLLIVAICLACKSIYLLALGLFCVAFGLMMGRNKFTYAPPA
jgi:1,4-dihydroxy-2-naphthoate octaprenyltransferase